jgi:hypothetical protein
MIRRAVQNVRFEFEEFVYENADAGEDDYYFASAGQGMRSGPNRTRRNVNFHCLGNYKDVDGDLDLIKLQIPNSQGKNNLETYMEWEKKVD